MNKATLIKGLLRFGASSLLLSGYYFHIFSTDSILVDLVVPLATFIFAVFLIDKGVDRAFRKLN